jgi:hypothetical protein
MFVIEGNLDLMTGEITNIREYHTYPPPVDTDKLAEEALKDEPPPQEIDRRVGRN